MSVPLATTETTRATALTAGAISKTTSIAIGMKAALAEECPAAAEEINHGVEL